MLIKKTITTKTEETVEVEFPQYLREITQWGNPSYVALTAFGAVKVTTKNLVWFEEFYSDDKRESAVSEYLSKYESCSEGEFFDNYNKALNNIHSFLPDLIPA
jgi:hypothetical protein